MLTEAARPAFPPVPIMYPERERRQVVREGMVSTDVGMPVLKTYRMPE